MTKIRSALLLASVLWCVAFAQSANAGSFYLKEAVITETAGTFKITANSPRPLEQALNALQRKYGWIVNYEDPKYESTVDLTQRSDDHSLLPSGGEFKFEFATASPDEEDILRRMVGAYNKSNNPGHFELRRVTDGTFYVVGVASHNEKGGIVPQQAPFDIPLTLAIADESIDDTVNRICAELSKQIHADLILAISPKKALVGSQVSVGGKKVAARELLAKSMLATHERMYWRLLFDPSSKRYYLNLHLAHGS